MPDQPTLRSLAAELGVHHTTVARALQDSLKVSAALRERAQHLAAERGYKPDPLLSALSRYRRKDHKTSYQGVIAWLNNYPQVKEMYQWGNALEYFQGAKTQASKLGYDLQEFWLHDPALAGERFNRVLRTRGVNGVIFAPMSSPGTKLKIDLRALSAVALGTSMQSPLLHMVTTDGYRALKTIFLNLKALGYRRIGFLWHRQFEQRSLEVGLGGYATEWLKCDSSERVEPLYFEDNLQKLAFQTWLQDQRPDVVISQYPPVEDLLTELGLRVPHDIGLCFAAVTARDLHRSGVIYPAEEVGAIAMRQLASLIQNREQGVPTLVNRILIEGTWNSGTTTRSLT